tara:strand:+ start:269 stop:805 length:537 start_codon:yes stop_codon:yes gene_type:complete
MGKYIEQYKQMYYTGDMLFPNLEYIVKLIELTQAKSLLDFGCGKGKQYSGWGELTAHITLGMMPALYDPGVKEFEKVPEGKFDGVYSTDVMEHIPKEELSDALEIIFNKASKFVFLAICTQPAMQLLPNGENAHCTLEPIEWWKEIVEKYRPSEIRTEIRTYGNIYIGGLCNSYEVLG